jgi:hypothetical protein
MSVANAIMKPDISLPSLISILRAVDKGELADIGKSFTDIVSGTDGHNGHHQPPYHYSYDDVLYYANNYSYDMIDVDDIENGHQAVACAALSYMTDISTAKDPVLEYKALQDSTYYPYDNVMCDRFRQVAKNPSVCVNPLLNVIFNPMLPKECYQSDTLEALCRAEGYDSSDFYDLDSDCYQLLQLNYLEYTFVSGRQPGITNEVTTSLDNIADLRNCEIVCFGVRNGVNSRFVAYTYGELYDVFNTFNRFENPDDRCSDRLFPEQAMRKLLYLCGLPKKSSENSVMYSDRQDLLRTINRIQTINNVSDLRIKQLLDTYRQLDIERKQLFDRGLRELLAMAMYMRGWDGPGSKMPLRSRDTVSTDQTSVDIKVCKSICRFEEICGELGDLGRRLKNLPFMMYDRGDSSTTSNATSSYSQVNDVSEGFTIGERIDIVRQGDTIYSINSCIRMSSNRLAASANYYMNLFGLGDPFDINSLDEIS